MSVCMLTSQLISLSQHSAGSLRAVYGSDLGIAFIELVHNNVKRTQM